MRRRTFIVGAGAAAAGGAWARDIDAPLPRGKGRSGLKTGVLDGIPSFCSHEHWGSIDAIGMLPEGFRADVECGALPNRTADIFDLVLDPYFRGQLASSGDDVERLPRPSGLSNFRAWAAKAPEDAFKALEPIVERHVGTGTFQCIRLGVQTLYGEDLADWAQVRVGVLNRAIAERYGQLFDWYDEVRKRVRFSAVIRPVHPEFYWRDASPATAERERARYRTVVRIDPLLDLWPTPCARRDALVGMTGIDPVDAGSWRAFLARIMDVAAEHGAVGIKQLQAYGRALDFVPREDSEVRFRGALSQDEVRAFEDWVVHACCQLADARGWPHQIHVGTHNLPHSSPLPLAELAKRYPRMKLVLLHNWPFIKESGWLARQHANVYLDTCWLPVLDPAFYREAMNAWVGYVPSHKITCGHDATSIEMATGSAMFVRGILAEVLEAHARENHLPASCIERWATGFMHDNAVALYGVGQRA